MNLTMGKGTDSSIMTSLADLARIERERVDGDAARSRREREEAALAEANAVAERLRLERAQAEAAEQADRERTRGDVEARIRAEARAQAAGDVARIAAAAKAQLDTDNAVRAHDLAVLQVRAEAGSKWPAWGALALAACVAVAAGFSHHVMSGEVAALDGAVRELRAAQQATVHEDDQARAALLATFEARMASVSGAETPPPHPRDPVATTPPSDAHPKPPRHPVARPAGTSDCKTGDPICGLDRGKL